MNGQKTLFALCLCLMFQNVCARIPLLRNVVDTAGLASALRLYGFSVASSYKESFEATKSSKIKVLRNGLDPKACCEFEKIKITEVANDRLFVRATRTQEEEMVKFTETGGASLREQYCNSNVQTAYVLTLRRAIDRISQFLQYNSKYARLQQPENKYDRRKIKKIKKNSTKE